MKYKRHACMALFLPTTRDRSQMFDNSPISVKLPLKTAGPAMASGKKRRLRFEKNGTCSKEKVFTKTAFLVKWLL